jgi:hypothetical protein
MADLAAESTCSYSECGKVITTDCDWRVVEGRNGKRNFCSPVCMTLSYLAAVDQRCADAMRKTDRIVGMLRNEVYSLETRVQELFRKA